MANRFKIVINGVELEITRDSDGKFVIPDHLRGLGSALKPAHEPIAVARKPFKGTVAANVLGHGTGALNIDACRIGAIREGRFPSNVIHDGSEEIEAEFAKYGSKGGQDKRKGLVKGSRPGGFGNVGHAKGTNLPNGKLYGDSGTASRFFYCAKTTAKDRHEGMDSPGPQFKHGSTLRKIENAETKGNNHPTVKPTALMRYLIRLVTPSNGIILDPFMGSGSTGKAAMLEGFKFAGIDMTEEYVEIARVRIRHARSAAKLAAGSK
jgi:hypothetical protein